MKAKFLFALLAGSMMVAAHAQMPPAPEEMKSVAWMAGTWEGDLKMSFGGPEMTSKAKMVNSMVLDGRYMKSENSYEMEGMGTMHGQMMLTYNPDKKTWMSWWFDSMSPDMMESSGTMEGGTCTMVSKPTPMMGENVVMRSTFKKVSDTKLNFKLEMQQGADWTTMMHGDYTKK